jgi:hypothetical protein
MSTTHIKFPDRAFRGNSQPEKGRASQTAHIRRRIGAVAAAGTMLIGGATYGPKIVEHALRATGFSTPEFLAHEGDKIYRVVELGKGQGQFSSPWVLAEVISDRIDVVPNRLTENITRQLDESHEEKGIDTKPGTWFVGDEIRLANTEELQGIGTLVEVPISETDSSAK